MAVTAKPLLGPLLVPAAETSQYVTPTGTRTIIDKFTATNTTAAVASLTVKLVPSGGSVGAGNTIVSQKVIQPNETYTFPEIVGHVLGPGDAISTLSSVNTALTVRASGREVS